MSRPSPDIALSGRPTILAGQPGLDRLRANVHARPRLRSVTLTGAAANSTARYAWHNRNEPSGDLRKLPGIGDWYSNHEHAADRDHTYDPANDEIRDPFSFGEDPRSRVLGKRPSERSQGRLHKRKARGPKKSVPPKENEPGQVKLKKVDGPMIVAIQQWAAKNPRGSAKDCLGYLTSRGWPEVPLKAVKWAMHQKAVGANQRVTTKAQATTAASKLASSVRPAKRGTAQKAEPDEPDASIRRWLKSHPNGTLAECQHAMTALGLEGISRRRVRRISQSIRRSSMVYQLPIASQSQIVPRVACPSCSLIVGPQGQCRCG